MTSTSLDPRPDRTALLTIDVQRDFALPSSPAHIPGTAQAAQRIAGLLKAFRLAGRHMVRLHLPDGSNAEVSRRVYIEAGNRLVSPGTPGPSSSTS